MAKEHEYDLLEALRTARSLPLDQLRMEAARYAELRREYTGLAEVYQTELDRRKTEGELLRVFEDLPRLTKKLEKDPYQYVKKPNYVPLEEVTRRIIEAETETERRERERLNEVLGKFASGTSDWGRDEYKILPLKDHFQYTEKQLTPLEGLRRLEAERREKERLKKGPLF